MGYNDLMVPLLTINLSLVTIANLLFSHGCNHYQPLFKLLQTIDIDHDPLRRQGGHSLLHWAALSIGCIKGQGTAVAWRKSFRGSDYWVIFL